MQKRGPRTHYSAAQKGTATGDWVEGVSPVGPTTSKGIVPVGQPLKAAACVRVLTKLRLSSFSTMWNFAYGHHQRCMVVRAATVATR